MTAELTGTTGGIGTMGRALFVCTGMGPPTKRVQSEAPLSDVYSHQMPTPCGVHATVSVRDRGLGNYPCVNRFESSDHHLTVIALIVTKSADSDPRTRHFC